MTDYAHFQYQLFLGPKKYGPPSLLLAPAIVFTKKEDGQTDRAKSTPVLTLIKNIYSLPYRSRLLLGVTNIRPK